MTKEGGFTFGREPPSWALARRLSAAGTAAVIVPSFAQGATADDVNLVVWRWTKTQPYQVCVIDDADRLPRNDRSGR